MREVCETIMYGNCKCSMQFLAQVRLWQQRTLSTAVLVLGLEIWNPVEL